MEFKCDLNCPVAQPARGVCCGGCAGARKSLKNSFPHLWSDKYGFGSPRGCKLTREQMPAACKEYTCKQSVWLSTIIWQDEWKTIGTIAVEVGNEVVVRNLQSGKERCLMRLEREECLKEAKS